MLIDALSINLALFCAFVFTLTWQWFSAADTANAVDVDTTQQLLNTYLVNAPILTVVALAIFMRAGFYTYGRNYQGQYRGALIAAAVVGSFLVYALLTHFVWDQLAIPPMPWPLLLLACGFSVGVILLERAWPQIWDQVLRPEREVKLRCSVSPGCRVLVTGGAGYIGSALLPKLLQSGYRVRVLDRLVYGTKPIQQFLDHPRFELIEGDVRHVDDVVQAMHDVHAVIHLAAIVGDPACELDRDLTTDVNLHATQTIAEVAKANGIQRFIFASTCSVYGANDRILDESSETRPVSHYGRTKLAAERGLRQMMDETFRPTILRFSTIYGFSGRTRFDLVVNLLAAKAKIDGVITIQGGNQWRPFLHVDDAAHAIATVVGSDFLLVGGETFNVGSDEQNYTISQVGELVNQQVADAQVVVDDRTTDRRNYRISFWKIRTRLGFKPNWTLEQGIKQVVESVACGAVVDYHNPIYSNQKFLSECGAMDAIRGREDWSVFLNPDTDAPKHLTLAVPGTRRFARAEAPQPAG